MNLKKIGAIVLALAMAMSLCVTAYAQETFTNKADDGNKDFPGSSTIDVTGKYNGDPADVYSVDVEWGAMMFTYNAGTGAAWDPETHTYSTDASTSWSAEGNTVTVTNHSNKDVNATFSFAKEASVNGTYTASFAYAGSQNAAAGDTVKLNAGVENAPNDADKVVATMTLDGALAASNKDTADLKLGTITVALTAA